MSSRMRKNSGQTGKRRSHHKIGEKRLSEDDGVFHLRHRASLETGTYRGEQVLDVRSKRQKQLERARRKAKSRGDDPSEVTGEQFDPKEELTSGT